MKSVRLLVVFAVLPVASSAQNIPKDFASDLKYGALDALSVYAAPFRPSLKGYAVGVSGLALIGLSAFGDDNTAAWIRHHQKSGAITALKPWRERDGFSLVDLAAGNWNTQGALGVYTIGLLARSRTVRDLGMGCLAGAEAHSAVRQLVYMSVSRERPLYLGDGGADTVARPGRPYVIRFPGKDTGHDNSFFAGHATTAMSCVSFVNTRFHLGYAEPAIWAFGGALALSRMADQRHYLSDVLLGSFLGYGVGKVVGDRSRKRQEKRDLNGATVAPDSGKLAERSWTDGLYFSNRGPSMVLGWKTTIR